ncbi:hypothetical protein J4727_03910 [Providencia rettgeri]|uniref:Uncharacterized protein n=1 Tax=Providencia rettgeri TaxID=587 RepID=A0A939NJK1_PRORE|nr:hypothetical protein [Providencia rettgeri]
MIHRVLNRHYSNRSFLKIWVYHGFEQIYHQAKAWDVARVSEETDVPSGNYRTSCSGLPHQ